MRKILIVDDSGSVRKQVADALESLKVAVIEASDGLQGLALALEQTELALILLDVNMPGLNGLETLERLKASSKTRDIPVLMLTTEVESSLIERAKKGGAKAWLIKPVKPHLLLEAAKKLLAPATPEK